VATAQGRVQWRRPPDFHVVRTLVAGTQAIGLAFGPDHNLYVPTGSQNTISVFDTTGTLIDTFGTGFTDAPSSIGWDVAGNAYVGQANQSCNWPCAPGDPSGDILKLDPGGNLVDRYDVAISNAGPRWLDLGADQCTIYYTSDFSTPNDEGIRRFDVCRHQQMPDFTGDLSNGDGYLEGVRVLPSGVLLAAPDGVKRIDPSGSVVQAYGSGPVKRWNPLALAEGGSAFWSADGDSDSTVAKFDVATGQVLTQFRSGSTEVGGLALYQGPPGPAAPPPPTPLSSPGGPQNPKSLPEISVSSIQVPEGDSGTSVATFVLSLSAPTTTRVTGRYETIDGAAMAADQDYSSRQGGFVFPVGATSIPVRVGIVGDTKVEPDEGFSIRLSSISGATPSEVQGSATILNDDAVPHPDAAPLIREVGSANTGSANPAVQNLTQHTGQQAQPGSAAQAQAQAQPQPQGGAQANAQQHAQSNIQTQFQSQPQVQVGLMAEQQREAQIERAKNAGNARKPDTHHAAYDLVTGHGRVEFWGTALTMFVLAIAVSGARAGSGSFVTALVRPYGYLRSQRNSAAWITGGYGRPREPAVPALRKRTGFSR